MMPNFAGGHNRTQSAGQHLIVERQESGEEDEDVERCEATTVAPIDPLPLGSTGVFPGGPSPHDSPRSGLHNTKARRTRWSQLWTNRWSVLLAVVLFLVGTTALILAVVSHFVPNAYIGWWIVIPGTIAFLPGAYHCFYIICTLLGREGYDLDRLPTFKR